MHIDIYVHIILKQHFLQFFSIYSFFFCLLTNLWNCWRVYHCQIGNILSSNLFDTFYEDEVAGTANIKIYLINIQILRFKNFSAYRTIAFFVGNQIWASLIKIVRIAPNLCLYYNFCSLITQQIFIKFIKGLVRSWIK